MVMPRYSHHRHTGRLRPHHETSYGLLLFLLLACAVGLMAVSSMAKAATGNGPTSDKPTGPAVITSPANGQAFQANPITMTGTCPERSFVKVFKNGALAGSVLCGVEQQFSLKLDLLVGSNKLTARAYSLKDEAGPESPPINTSLNINPGGPGFSTELLLQSINFYRLTQTGNEVIWPVEVIGGQAPYAVSFDWGDKKSDVVARVAGGPFAQKHTFTKAGGYLDGHTLVVQAADAAGHKAYLQLVTIVQDQESKVANPWVNLMIIWPILVLLVLMVLSFWLGERREKRVLEKRLAIVS